MAATVPSFDMDGLFAGLALSLKDVHANAEKIVKRHVAKLGGKGAEAWLSQGLHFGVFRALFVIKTFPVVSS